MPEIRYYIVTQKREVKVSASTPLDASILADRVFSGTKKPEDQIDILSPVIERVIEVREDH
jgi:hypothetical protein